MARVVYSILLASSQRGKRASPATDAPAATPFRASAQIMMST
jgi:hypothetical protein